MIKRLMTIIAVLAMFGDVCANGRDFTYTYQGETLNYTILDEEAKTCATKAGSFDSEMNAIYSGNDAYGNLVIPAIVYDGTDQYTVVEIGDYGFTYRNLESAILPYSIQIIGKMAFFGTRLTHVALPGSLTEIKSQAFYITCLTELVIPENVSRIGESAFGTNLERIWVEASIPPHIESDTFMAETYDSAVLYVPGESMDAYKDAPNWNRFLNLESEVREIDIDSILEVGRYSISGTPVDSDYKGVVIIRYSDGSARKVVVK